MEEDLTTYLLSQAGVTAQIGTRLYWVARKQGSATPGAVLTVVSDLPSYSMEGDNDLGRTRIQVDVYSDKYSTAKQAARAINAALQSYQGTTGNTSFRGVFKDGAREGFEAGGAMSADGSERFFRVSTDYVVHHKSA